MTKDKALLAEKEDGKCHPPFLCFTFFTSRLLNSIQNFEVCDLPAVRQAQRS
jgi:hypothetical protein